MTLYILDTNVVSNLMRRVSGPVASTMRARPDDDMAINPIILGELEYGVRKSGSAQLQERLSIVERRLPCIDLATSVSKTYGEIRTNLEASGTPIGANDLWIAAHAMTLDATLVTANEREFRRVEGLNVENWLQ